MFKKSSRWVKLYDPSSNEPFKISRSKIDLFIECQRCFYLDKKLGVVRPRGPAFTLNVAVDALMKKEFDLHRKKKTAHPLMEQYGIKAVPFDHSDLATWRENFVGIQYLHEKSNLLIFGAVDDIWIDEDDKLMIVDYKATSKEGDIVSLSDTKWELQYKRQMEIYQWLLRQKGFRVSDTGYFVYVNGKKDRQAFDGKLEFDVTIISHKGQDKWVEPTIEAIHECLKSPSLPKNSPDCEFCAYRTSAGTEIQKIYSSGINLPDTEKPKTIKSPKAAVKSQTKDTQTLF